MNCLYRLHQARIRSFETGQHLVLGIINDLKLFLKSSRSTLIGFQGSLIFGQQCDQFLALNGDIGVGNR